ELIDDEETCLDNFFNEFNNFVKILEINSIPDHLLSPNTSLFVHEGIQYDKFSSSRKYLVPLDIDIEKWVHNYKNGDLTYTIAQQKYNNESKGQLLDFIIPIIKKIIYQINTILFDTIFDTNKNNDLFYIFLLLDPKTEKEIPFVHLISFHENTTSI
ncbi:13752_t:CDS:2, partial [Cetraspora pellucida]